MEHQGQDKEPIKTHPVRTNADKTPQVSPGTLAKLKQEHPEWFQQHKQTEQTATAHLLTEAVDDLDDPYLREHLLGRHDQATHGRKGGAGGTPSSSSAPKEPKAAKSPKEPKAPAAPTRPTKKPAPTKEEPKAEPKPADAPTASPKTPSDHLSRLNSLYTTSLKRPTTPEEDAEMQAIYDLLSKTHAVAMTATPDKHGNYFHALAK